jgi:hypothetical protein
MTGPDGRSQQPQATEPTGEERTVLCANSEVAQPPDTWTTDAAYPADSPVPYTLTAKAETLLADTGSPTYLLRNTHPCGIGTRPPQARPGLSGQPRGYITEISLPPSDSGIHRLHSRMKEPEPEPEAGL